MDFTVALLFYFIILVLVLVGTYKMGINLFSALTVALLIAGVFLMILVPPTDLDKYTDEMIDGCEHHKRDDVAVNVFCAIYLITLVIIIWYVLDKAYYDRIF